MATSLVDRGDAAPVDTLPLLLTVAELANLGRVSRNRIYEAIQTGQLRVVRLGRTIRVPRDAALTYLGLSDQGASDASAEG